MYRAIVGTAMVFFTRNPTNYLKEPTKFAVRKTSNGKAEQANSSLFKGCEIRQAFSVRNERNVAESIKLTQTQQKTSEKKATEPNFNQITNQEEVGGTVVSNSLKLKGKRKRKR